uniref:DNA (cytosine-5-)-methyltransferase n=1 Tax=Strigamia maritima TaxID=126957 RepID=T1IZS9_STRMM
MPLTERVQGSDNMEDDNNQADEEEDSEDYEFDASVPAALEKKIEVDDVWEGEPSNNTDEEDCNFLGFRSRTTTKVNGTDGDIVAPKKRAKAALVRRVRRRRRGRTVTKSLRVAGNSEKAKIIKPKKKHQLSCVSPKRGQNGWEDSLRPRPAQAQHYQKPDEFLEKLQPLPMTKKEICVEELVRDDIDEGMIDETNESSLLELGDLGGKKRGLRGMKRNRKRRGLLMNGDTQQEDAEQSELLLRAQANRSNSRKQVPNGVVVPKSVAVVPKPEGSEQDSETEPRYVSDASVGEVVWAKLGSTRWWPAILIWGSDCGQQPAHAGNTWIFWFGDHKISEIPRDRLADFTVNYNRYYSGGGSKAFHCGVIEAIRECAARAKVDISDSDSNALLEWAEKGFISESKSEGVFLPDPNNSIPANIRKHVNKIKEVNLLYFQGVDTKGHQVAPARTPRNDCLDNKDSGLRKVKEGLIKIEKVCIACDSDRVPITSQHPLFVGGLCKQCKDDIIETMYAFGEDGTNAYCVICGNAGELLICDNNDCNRVYCTGCIEIMVSPEACKKVLETSPWLCYLCTEYNPESNGLIIKKDDWQQNITQLFQPEKHVQIPNIEDYKEKRPMRVLSLFDGIGTGRYVLDSLGIDIEIYYSSEIDLDAVNVATVQHYNKVVQLGNVEELTDAEIAKLCPIDLVIGGSPCNDLSLVNPARKGLYDPTGTGKLFFDFFRILKAVQLANMGRHVFWLYENVASMPQEYKVTISRFLQVPPTTIVSSSSSCDPALLDSKYFSPQNRARYFWGNIPGMYTPLQPHMLQKNITLDNVLTPNLNRKAVVSALNDLRVG